ncbi:hypothetical protein B4U80_03777 [Leptotrombidium deliense]|uniref:OTU domain-containing protein n=1 Tax=Leptotrombidium deliense TaxID=299467 RepID=A0A443RYS7_9ACAR|nr:hypothetical protein B4U80_03777 [Leptotrombidium deliense]
MFVKTLRLKKNARVILLRNLDIDNGWVNGTICRVLDMLHWGVVVCKESNYHVRMNIMRQRWNITPKNQTAESYRIQLPLDLAYALTIHKTQGLTLDDVIIDMKNVWQSGQAYVAMSRVRNDKNLKILSYDKSNIKIDPYYKALIKWFIDVDHFHGQYKKETRPIPNESVVPKDLHDSDGYDSDSDFVGMDTHEDLQPPEPVRDFVKDDQPKVIPLSSSQLSCNVVLNFKKYIQDTHPQRGSRELLLRANESSRQILNKLLDFHRQFSSNIPTFRAKVNEFLESELCEGVALTVYRQLYSAEPEYANEYPPVPVDTYFRAKLNEYHQIFNRCFKVVETPGSGNCLYHSISFNLLKDMNYTDLLRFAYVHAYKRQEEQRMGF